MRIHHKLINLAIFYFCAKENLSIYKVLYWTNRHYLGRFWWDYIHVPVCIELEAVLVMDWPQLTCALKMEVNYMIIKCGMSIGVNGVSKSFKIDELEG